MKQTTIPIKPDAKVNIKSTADLSVEGSKDQMLTAIVEDRDSLRMSEENGVIELKANSDCRVLLPDTAQVTVEKVGGDVSIRGIHTRVLVGKVGGDAVLQEINGASIEMVGGDLSIRNISGTVELARAGGDIFGETIESIICRNVGGDLDLFDIIGKIEVSNGGDAVVSIKPVTAAEMNIHSGGDIKLILPENVNAQLNLHSDAEEISVHACGQDVEIENEEFSLPLGEGGSVINLNAGGEIEVTNEDDTPHDFQDIFDDVQDDWKDFGIELERRIRSGLDAASEAMEKATKQAEQVKDKAQAEVEKVIRHLDGKHFMHNKKGKVVGFTLGEQDSAQPKVKGVASDEERMLVLRMLQEKKISVEEAEKLLNALDH